MERSFIVCFEVFIVLFSRRFCLFIYLSITCISAHASRGEVAQDGKDAFVLSSRRAMAVTRFLIKRGVPAQNITTVFYGDTRPVKLAGRPQAEIEEESRRVEFILRKTDLESNGHKVDSY